MLNQHILDAFGLTDEPIKLEGGQGKSYKVGPVVIKENNGDNKNIDFISEILLDIDNVKYRITKPARALDGRLIVDGYISAYYEEGDHDGSKIEETLRISDLFHEDLARYDWGRLKTVENQWSIAMDHLFQNRGLPDDLNAGNKEICMKMLAQLKEVHDPMQIIHGDIGGNVLYHDGLPPCIIDFSPNVAPRPMASAIAVVDHIAWGGGKISDLDRLKVYVSDEVYLKYAVMFRLLTALVGDGLGSEMFESEYEAYGKIWDILSA